MTTAHLSELIDDVISGITDGTMDGATASRLIAAANAHVRVATLRHKCGVCAVEAGEVVLVRRPAQARAA